MKYLIPVIIILFVTSCKKEEFSPRLTKEFSIQSISNGANYKIKVGLPENYDPAVHKYATIYLLDGEENFDFVATKCNEISQDFSTSNMLVVSIGYGYDRTVDYTPTHASEGNGGANEFMMFIRNELIPKMEHDFSADTIRRSRVILGHSFGGLYAAFAFTKYNDVFGNYIMLSPSLWYDNEILLRYEQDNRNDNNLNHQVVFMGIGELERSGRMFAPYEAFYQRLKNNYTHMKVESRMESHLDHMGSKNPNIIKGLKFYFQNR
ncbi:MAG: alpha/beta hydrolase [Bacteroidetes bacterium]|nr:alpha/beta hydrolase [Bacteroidota bacterium]